ncbi:MAG: metallophosphoesterase [Acetobacteraceae bacterium]|nr:metallophosphoesterase [Acetobacteraceae bacterium]
MTTLTLLDTATLSRSAALFDHAGIVFVGDIHRRWDHVARGLTARVGPLRHVVLLGDMECTLPLDKLAAPILAHGAGLHWIFGNHDADGGPEMWANLADPRRNPRTAAGALHGRVVELGGLRIAGLGGTFHTRVWNPPAPPRLHSRDQLAADLATLGPGWSADATASLATALAGMAIWPEDVEALSRQRADILVTHEAPSSHRSGVAVLDDLARAMGASLVVHGHHHTGYRAVAEDGLEVQGVGAGWGIDLAGRAHWQGDRERALPRVAGWRYR